MSNPTLVHGKRQSLGKTIWKHRASYLLMAPYFILFFFFTVLPVLMARSEEHTSELQSR